VKPYNLLYFYRILNWRDKISCLRPLAYTALGYAMAGYFRFGPALRNALAVAGVLAFSYVLNDYYDFRLLGENSFLAALVKKGRISLKTAFIFCWPPLLLAVLLPTRNPAAVALFILLFLLTTIYSWPPLRLKERKIWGFFTPPACAVVIFLQSYLLFADINFTVAALAVLILLFHLYVEAIHQVADCVFEGGDQAKTGRYVTAAKWLPAISLAAAAVVSFFNPIFIISVVFSLVRLIAARRIDVVGNILQIRKNFLTPIWSIYEFLIYGFLGIFNFINR
jgi:hypothetical protein